METEKAHQAIDVGDNGSLVWGEGKGSSDGKEWMDSRYYFEDRINRTY